ncbi:MAG: hypothetical protein H0T60_10370 [Acidobacteria bacterium]|nr:hypothetical protein [Acidobacteriota bacterium]
MTTPDLKALIDALRLVAIRATFLKLAIEGKDPWDELKARAEEVDETIAAALKSAPDAALSSAPSHDDGSR